VLDGVLGGQKEDGRLEALLAQTPADLQYYITDAFEKIVLYDNKAVSADVTSTPDHKYKVTLKVQSRKIESDGSGNETQLPLHDLIEIGVFHGKKDEEKPLYLKKEWLTKATQTFEIIVDRPPTRAGIDPLNKLIDRPRESGVLLPIRPQGRRCSLKPIGVLPGQIVVKGLTEQLIHRASFNLAEVLQSYSFFSADFES